ncbi:MAG: signal peptidase I [Blautia sp.]|nr:signal peptidase I [Blautia sp.]
MKSELKRIRIKKRHTAAFIILLAILMLKRYGFQCYVILSGSMEPAFPIGCVVIVNPCLEPKTGDVITYQKADDFQITHRVIDITYDETSPGCTLYHTKGDANSTKDEGFVKRDEVQGVVIAKIPLLGYFIIFMQNLFFIDIQ